MHSSPILFGDGSFKREGMAAVIQWMIDKGYSQNLEYYQSTVTWLLPSAAPTMKTPFFRTRLFPTFTMCIQIITMVTQ